MKEIRFRAWEKDYKYMNYKVMVGNVWDEENYQWVDPKRVDYECAPGWKHFDENSNIELMQYTGLKDKNGTEIYEGDIVLDKLNNEYGEVVFDEGCFLVLWQEGQNTVYQATREFYIEVVGNVYENENFLRSE